MDNINNKSKKFGKQQPQVQTTLNFSRQAFSNHNLSSVEGALSQRHNNSRVDPSEISNSCDSSGSDVMIRQGQRTANSKKSIRFKKNNFQRYQADKVVMNQ